jgi:hypothetical protein
MLPWSLKTIIAFITEGWEEGNGFEYFCILGCYTARTRQGRDGRSRSNPTNWLIPQPETTTAIEGLEKLSHQICHVLSETTVCSCFLVEVHACYERPVTRVLPILPRCPRSPSTAFCLEVTRQKSSRSKF